MRSLRRVPAILIGVLLISACVSVALGADPIVVRTEQALSASDVIYKAAMEFYFAPGVASLGQPTVQVFESVRTGFDPAYKAVQSSLDTYKILKAATTPDQAAIERARSKLAEDRARLAGVVNAALPALPAANRPKAVEVQ